MLFRDVCYHFPGTMFEFTRRRSERRASIERLLLPYTEIVVFDDGFVLTVLVWSVI